MADPDPTRDPDDEGTDSLSSFDIDGDDPSPAPQVEEREAPTPSEGDDWLSQRGRTITAVVLALAFGIGTIVAASQIVEQAGTEVALSEMLVVGLIAVAIGAAAFIPLRWNLWVVPFVAVAHYVLNFYNMLFTDQSVYQFVEASAVGYAVFTPAIGVVLGWILQGVYSMVAP